jgi:hypothetical protein
MVWIEKKTIPLRSSVKISEGDKILFNETTSERELELPFKISGNTRVEVSWRNRTAAKTF